MARYVEPGRRLMDRAYLRDGEITHTGEALALALLLHAHGDKKRSRKDIEQVAKMLDDPNRKPTTRRS
jgi:hypothetical protein